MNDSETGPSALVAHLVEPKPAQALELTKDVLWPAPAIAVS